jgi:hypothetical protein
MLRQTFRHYRVLNVIAVIGALALQRRAAVQGARGSERARGHPAVRAGTSYTCLFILVTASLSGIKPGLATKPPASAQARGAPCPLTDAVHHSHKHR